MHADEVETETVSAEAKVTKSPTKNATGMYCYVSMPFENSAFEKQVKQISVIPALKDMKTMLLPSGLLSVEEEAFCELNCEAIIIPYGCTTIQSKAFAECDNLFYVFIPSTVTNISEDAFEGCNNIIIDRQE